MVDSNPSTETIARVDGSAPPHVVASSDDVPMISSDIPAETVETDYGPWMFIGHRRDRARGHIDNSRATHVTTDVAAANQKGLTER